MQVAEIIDVLQHVTDTSEGTVRNVLSQLKKAGTVTQPERKYYAYVEGAENRQESVQVCDMPNKSVIPGLVLRVGDKDVLFIDFLISGRYERTVANFEDRKARKAGRDVT